ncbi:MAG: DUF3443 domain-containing protein [Acidobacteria bacterium]|nr:DUF3443 domain-containing protein [Acidobacteriota bacterium]
MKLPDAWQTKLALCSLLSTVLLGLAGCGGSSSSSTPTTPTTPVNNTQAIEVNLGPANNYPNGVFTNVTVCVPGTSTCQTIPNVLVDSGSEGLRLLSSEVTLSLPAITDNSSNALQECTGFADGSYVWGPVVSADIKLAGETASSVPVQLIDSLDPTTYAVPQACTSGGGSDENTVEALGANGILGVGVFQQDCGNDCTSASSSPLPWYYLCPNGVCSAATVPLQYQLQNPVWMFPQDNNGVLISLPSISADGAVSASGSLIFGIGTQSDNALGNAQIYTTDSSGNFHSIYNNVDYSNSFIDSGSNGIFFLDSATLGIPDCTNNPGWYCPSSTQSYTVTNKGLNGTSNPVTFNIANADALFAGNNGLNAAFNNLGGDSGTSPSTDYVDYGVPFFFGRNVFIGIENEPAPNNAAVGPYWAY